MYLSASCSLDMFWDMAARSQVSDAEVRIQRHRLLELFRGQIGPAIRIGFNRRGIETNDFQ